MVVVQPVGSLARVRVDLNGFVKISQMRLGRASQACGTEIGRIAVLSKLIVVGVPLRVERSVEEQMVLESGNVASNLSIQVVIALVKDLALEVKAFLAATRSKIIRKQTSRFKLLRSEVAADGAMQLVRA